LRWAIAAVVLGFCGAISLWAFEFGKDIAGIDRTLKEELAQVKDENAKLKADREKAQSTANASYSAIAAEKAAQAALMQQIKTLEAENRQLRDDLGFFEKLLPAGSTEGLTLRGFTAEMTSASQLQWQFLLIHAARNAPQFTGRFELALAGTLGPKPWTQQIPSQALSFQQTGRMRGVIDLPAQVVVKTVTLKVFEGNQQRATQTIKL
ncbi:MAG: hypothetical protein RLZZ271_1, partial [Pseudomonadota bacterium]